MGKRRVVHWAALLAVLGLILVAMPREVRGQIGGRYGSEGPFTIDDVEDLNLHSANLGRNWVPDYNGGEPALAVDSVTSASLTLASGQSPVGLFRLRGKASFSYVSKGFGVPVPSQQGMSTLSHPGDLSSFETLTFLACSPSLAVNLRFQVTLESYPQNPNMSFPKMHWTFVPPVGTTFGPISLDLRMPDAFTGAEGHDVEALLSNARFLSFYSYAGPVGNSTVVNLYVDDIQLIPPATGMSDCAWELY